MAISATFQYPDTHHFRKLLGAVSVVTDDPSVKFDGNGISIRSFDPSHIAIVDFRLAGEFHGDPIITGISLPNLLKILRRSRAPEPITLTLSDRMDISFSNKVFSVPFVSPEPWIDRLPEYDMPIRIIMETKRFLEYVGDSALMSDYTTVSVENSTLTISSKGELSRELAKVKLSRDVGQAANTYNNAYLRSITDVCLPVSKEVRISFGKETPIELSFLVKDGSLDYFMARLEREPERPQHADAKSLGHIWKGQSGNVADPKGVSPAVTTGHSDPVIIGESKKVIGKPDTDRV